MANNCRRRQQYCTPVIIFGYVVAAFFLAVGITLVSIRAVIVIGDYGYFGYIPIGIGVAMMVGLRVYMVKKLREQAKNEHGQLGPGGVVINNSIAPSQGAVPNTGYAPPPPGVYNMPPGQAPPPQGQPAPWYSQQQPFGMDQPPAYEDATKTNPAFSYPS